VLGNDPGDSIDLDPHVVGNLGCAVPHLQSLQNRHSRVPERGRDGFAGALRAAGSEGVIHGTCAAVATRSAYESYAYYPAPVTTRAARECEDLAVSGSVLRTGGPWQSSRPPTVVKHRGWCLDASRV